MATATTQWPGIMSWTSCIRKSMANDPGRQILEDQIQGNGHLFLEDYLDNILAGPKHDPIIELVKTPGRKKDAPKKTRAATASACKAKAIMAMSLDEGDFDKENKAPEATEVPINAFHRALLQSKTSNSSFSDNNENIANRTSADKSRPAKPQSSSKKTNSKAKVVIISEPQLQETDVGDEAEDEKAVEELVTPPRLKSQPPSDHVSGPSHSPLPVAPSIIDHQSLAPVQPESHNDLSVIAEDDEYVEQSHRSMETSRNIESDRIEFEQEVALVQPTNTKPVHSEEIKRLRQPLSNIDVMDAMDIDDYTQTTTFTPSTSTSTSTQTFHTVSLNSPASLARTATPQASSESFPTATQPRHSLEACHPDNDSIIRELIPREELNVGVGDSKGSLAMKPSIPHFPTIGAPSPLRKSMRAPRGPSLMVAELAPAVVPPVPRSSWLVKAREAKAIEDNAKRTSALTVIPALGHVATGLKRKSGDMLGLVFSSESMHDEEDRKRKLMKIAEDSSIFDMPKDHDIYSDGCSDEPGEVARTTPEPVSDAVEIFNGPGSAGMINKLKKTVAGFSARAGRSMGKPLGEAAVTALAEAKAAAEAKIAERNATDVRVVPTRTTPHAPVAPESMVSIPVFVPPPREPKSQIESRLSKDGDKRLSVSDLVSKYEAPKTGTRHDRVFQPPPTQSKPASLSTYGEKLADASTSTTPPNSPPRTRPPIFTLPDKMKPEPTFLPPPSSQMFSQLGSVEPHAFSSHPPLPLSKQSTFNSTQSSTFSNPIFDNEMLAWMPSTQDTEYDIPVLSQNQQHNIFHRDTTEEANESWHLDDKFTETWTPVAGMKDDSMTWSTAPRRSIIGGDSDTLDVSMRPPSRERAGVRGESCNMIGSSPRAPLPTEELGDDDDDNDGVQNDDDAPSIRLVPSASQSTVDLVSSQVSQAHSRTNSQTSASTSQLGFLSSASKLVLSVMGGSKKGKAEPIKSIQLATAAAKKQQEEAEKKATRLREMEARRQQALQKKAEVEKTWEEKKIKDENERWKREREKEDITEKKATKQSGKKLTQIEDDLMKKRETKKPPPKDTIPTKIGKPALNSSQNTLGASIGQSKSLKQASSLLVNDTSSVKLTETKNVLASTSGPPSRTKGKGIAKESSLSSKPPAQVLQSQMQARVQAQLEEMRQTEQIPPPSISSEAIELPDINSEYSDSEDEDRVRTFDPPHWAQSPELREALQTQSTVDPDDIFGAIRPLRMEELFKNNRTSRFRARTSSANWAGTDELTAAEERAYARRMGYTS